jgi:hypothetical protein
MRSLKVVGAVVGKSNITLFLEGGTQEVLQQDAFRTQEILAKVMPDLAAGGEAVIDLDLYVTVGAVKFEEKINGDVKLTAGNTVIENGAALLPHVERAKLDGSKGFEGFLKKFGEIKRNYTRDELLKFLEHADLPFTDDGSILGYKILGQADGEYMTDHHSGRVRQRLGSLVYMPESKVDQSRALCSTGLHIAARPYLRGFWNSNSRLCLVKIQPKDVVSVPLNEHTKMRVSAYHIVKVFSQPVGQQIARDGKELHDIPESKQALEEAVAGIHGPIIERVEVRGYGEITVTPVETKIERVRKKVAKAVTRLRTKPDKTAPPRVAPYLVNALKKILKNKPELKSRDPEYLKKLAKAQNWLDKGRSLVWISENVGLDRNSMTANLKRPAPKKAA